MSLSTGSSLFAGVAPRGDSGRAGLPGKTGTSTAAAFEAAAQDVAVQDGAAQKAAVPAGAAGTGSAPKLEDGVTSFESPARGLVGWRFVIPQQAPATMAGTNAGLSGAAPGPVPADDAPGLPGSGEEPVPSAAPAAASPVPAASAGAAALAQSQMWAPVRGQGQAQAQTETQVQAAAIPSGPASGAPVPTTPPSALASTVFPAPVLPAAEGPAPAAALPTAAVPAGAPRLPEQQPAPAALSVPAAPSTGPAAATGTRTGRNTADVSAAAVQTRAAAPARLAGAEAEGKTVQPGVPAAAPAETAPAVRGSGAGLAAQQGAVSVQGTPAAPATVPATGTASLPAAAPAIVPGAVPQAAGPTARMAPVSAGAWRAGIEAAAGDSSAVQPPVVAPAPAAAAPATVPAAAPASAAAHSAPLLGQVSQPMVRLAGGAPGEHVITLSVNPESLGPVTVRALISSDGLRVEIFAPTDTGREALRHILADLRRDLAGGSAGTTATLTLSDQNSPGNGSGGSAADAENFGRPRTVPADESAETLAAAARPAGTAPHRSGPAGATPALDVMA